MKNLISFTKYLTIAIVLFVLNDCHREVKTKNEINVSEFLHPKNESKIHTWWHWVEGGITKEGITKDLETMKAQGIVQATILNVSLFQDKDFGVKKVRFDSAEWHQMFAWSLQESDRLGIKIGVHNCDGWNSSGGPWISPAQSMKTFTWSKSQMLGGNKISIALKKPFYRENYYEDVAVIAMPAKNKVSEFQKSNPVFILNDSILLNGMADGSASGGPILKWGDKLNITLDKPIKASKIIAVSLKPFSWADPSKINVGYNLFYSMDGKKYKKAANVLLKGINRINEEGFAEVEGKFFRLEFSEFPFADAWFPYTLTEIELLQKDEKPFVNVELLNAWEKNVTVKAQYKNVFMPSTSTIAGFAENEIIDLTSFMSKDGVLNWDAPAGNWNIIRFGYTTTAVKNAPATKEGEGLECDKMDSSVVAYHFSKFPQKLISTAGKYTGNTFKFILIDSWECGFQNWTKSMPEEFEKRRGYKLTQFIPALCGEIVNNAATSDAFLFDFRKTIADMIEDNYYKQFNTLCHKNKLEMHAEVIYGSGTYPPLDILKTNQYADMPMFEFWTGTNANTLMEYNAQKSVNFDFPASAALFYDKKILGAEAYTAMATYSENPWDLKPYGDRAYCSGINQMILHSYTHQPNASFPGMTLGPYASHFNRHTPWFTQADSWMDYQSRIQSMLQRGQMQADILYYVGDQNPQYLEQGKTTSVPIGYQIHACNFDVLKNKLKIKDNKLVYGNVAFSILTLPENMGMELATLKRIEELVSQGIIVYGTKPLQPLSLKEIKQDTQEFNGLVSKLWGNIDGNTITENTYGKGKVYWGQTMVNVLQKANIKPDFGIDAQDSLTFLYTHRVEANRDIYFVFNQTKEEVSRKLTFKTSKTSVRDFNAVNGEIQAIAELKSENGFTSFDYTFAPRESRLFVFENGKAIDGSKKPEVKSSAITDLKATLTFDTKGYAIIEPITITELKSLTEFENTQIKYFSGYVTYDISFSANETQLAASKKTYINLGEIGATASVTFNGVKLGTVWTPNASLDITGLLKSQNTMTIIVANEYRNRIIGDYVEYGSLKNVWTSAPIQDFLNKDKPLKPSGLIGPLKLIKVMN